MIGPWFDICLRFSQLFRDPSTGTSRELTCCSAGSTCQGCRGQSRQSPRLSNMLHVWSSCFGAEVLVCLAWRVSSDKRFALLLRIPRRNAGCAIATSVEFENYPYQKCHLPLIPKLLHNLNHYGAKQLLSH